MEREAAKKSELMYIKFENQKVPEFKQVRGKDWIYWGEKNDYPDYLIELYMRSSTHNAIITGKVDYIIGEGWKANKIGSTIVNQAILNSFINKINPDQTLEEISEPIILDFEIFNAVAFEVIWSKSGRDFYLYHIPFNKLRTNEDQSKYYYSNDWSQVNQSEEKTGLKEYLPFDPENKKGSSIYVYKITAPRKGKDPNVYPMPGYIGSTQAIETDIECSNYNLSEIKTGFSAGTILNFYNGIPEPEAKKVIEKQIKEKFSGTDRAGGIIINFADGKERGSDITALTGNDLDKRYIELKKDVRQEIFTGHKVSSPMLFGVKTEGQLGGRTEIAEAYELFQNTYISKRQRILEKIINKFVKLKGINGSIKLQPSSAISTNIFTEDVIVANLPAPAIRDLIAERMGIDLTKYQNTPVVNTTQINKVDFEEQQKLETLIIDGFSKCGRKKDLFRIIKKKEICFKDDVELLESEIRAFKEDDEDIEGDIIDIEKPSKVRTKIKTEILYSYELRHNAPALLPGGESRPFCKKLMEQDLLYSREEINNLKNEFGTDVWRYKGGWYTNPNTDAPTPQCRHTWVQLVVKRK